MVLLYCNGNFRNSEFGYENGALLRKHEIGYRIWEEEGIGWCGCGDPSMVFFSAFSLTANFEILFKG